MKKAKTWNEGYLTHQKEISQVFSKKKAFGHTSKGLGFITTGFDFISEGYK